MRVEHVDIHRMKNNNKASWMENKRDQLMNEGTYSLVFVCFPGSPWLRIRGLEEKRV
jgi:hypothetical protein